MKKEERLITKDDYKKIREKTIKYLYLKSINNSSRVKSYPKDNEDIKKPIGLDVFNVGVKSMENQIFVRVSFVGSGKFYELGIQKERFRFWCEFAESLYVDKPDLGFLDDIDDDDEDEEIDEFEVIY